MRRATRLLGVAGVLAVALGGCGGGKKATAPTSAPPSTRVVRAYFLLHGDVQPVHRAAQETSDLPAAALAALVAGPTASERKDLGLTSVVQETEGVTVSGSVAHAPVFDRDSLAQIVYTLTQFPTVKKVEMAGKMYTRTNFEDKTPAILVESPLPFENVESPLHATGTANTFEATFQYELLDAAGKVIAKHFVTATSGSGTRGTFDFTVPYPAGHAGPGTLVVYESSAKDGSRIHVVEIPLRLTG